MKSLALALALVATFSAASYAQTTAAATWQVQKYDLNVTLPQDNSRALTVRAVLNLKNVSGRPASTLTLRISPLAEVSAVKVNESVADFTKGEEKINSVTSLQRIAMRFASVAASAPLTATVDYKFTLKDNSAVASTSAVSTQLLPLSFWYPTPNSWFFTQGADAANVSIKVAARPGHAVVAAGTATTAGTYEHKLRGQPFFIAGEYNRADPKPSGVDVFSNASNADQTARAAELAKLFSEARAFVAAVLGKAPDVPLTIVTSRRGAGFSSGGLVVVDEAVLRRSRIDALTAMNIAEAAAKLWLGSSVAVTGEGYGTIAEGLSRYLATQFIESRFGKDVADIERLRQRNAYAGVSKRDAPMATVSPLDDFYYPEVANKGAMVWRILARRVGNTEFSRVVQAALQDGSVDVNEIRTALSSQKPLVDYLFDQVTDMNLQVGLPQITAGEARVNLRNTGATDVSVDVAATTATGEKIVVPTTIKAASFGEASFKTNGKVVRVEIDAEKLYPQTEYADDVMPRESTESDPLLAVKKLFDKQDFAGAESLATTLLRDLPRHDDLRVLRGRSLLALNRPTEADREFRAVLDERLPSARPLAWANVGLADVASRANQNAEAAKFAEAAIIADAEYGASLAARNLRSRLNLTTAVDAGVKAFFAEFDKAATANRKADIDALVLPGEVVKFASGVAGSTEQWQTQVRYVDRVDANTVIVEAAMTIKLLNKEVETGTAVYRLTKSGGNWKLSAVEIFEVR